LYKLPAWLKTMVSPWMVGNRSTRVSSWAGARLAQRRMKRTSRTGNLRMGVSSRRERTLGRRVDCTTSRQTGGLRVGWGSRLRRNRGCYAASGYPNRLSRRTLQVRAGDAEDGLIVRGRADGVEIGIVFQVPQVAEAVFNGQANGGDRLDSEGCPL